MGGKSRSTLSGGIAAADVDEAEREKLYAALERSIDQADRGDTIPFDEVMAELRGKRSSRTAR